MALDKFKAAPLPNPPATYEPQYVRQLIRVLETYFSQLDSNTPNHAETYTADYFIGRGDKLQFPFNQFISITDQTAPALDAYAAVQDLTATYVDDISITGANDTRITFAVPGYYSLTYSLSFKNTTNDLQTIDVWLRYNNGTTTVDVENSNSRFAIPARKSTGDPSYLVAVTPFSGFAEQADVWVEVVWRASDTAIVLEHLPAVTYSAGVTPAIPATPSAIIEVNFLSKAT